MPARRHMEKMTAPAPSASKGNVWPDPRLLPDWKVVGIDCSKLIVKRGALHCISRQVPSLDERK